MGRRRPAARTDCARLQRLHRLHDPHRGIPPLSGRQAAYPNGQARAHDEPAWCDWVRVASGQPARRRRFFDAAPRWLFWSLPPGVDGRDGPSLFLCFSDVWPSASLVARDVQHAHVNGPLGAWAEGRLARSRLPNDLLWPCPATRDRCFCTCACICFCFCANICAGIDICAGIASPALMLPC
jgi:hypothetical protein